MKKLPVFLIPALLTCTASAEAVVDGAAEAGEAAVGFFDKILNGITVANSAVSGVVWGVPALVLLAFVGILMTILTKVFQVSHFGHWMKKTIGAAIESLAAIVPTHPCTVHVAPGTYTLAMETDNPITVTNAIRIVGDGETALFINERFCCNRSTTIAVISLGKVSFSINPQVAAVGHSTMIVLSCKCGVSDNILSLEYSISIWRNTKESKSNFTFRHGATTTLKSCCIGDFE